MDVISFVFKLDELLISEYYKKIFKVETFQGRNINSEYISSRKVIEI